MNNRFWMIGLLIIMAVVCSTALALVNKVTAPIISMQNEIRYKRTVLEVFKIPYSAEDSDTIISTYGQNIEEREDGGTIMFIENKTGNTAISITGSGFQGPITLIVALKDGIITGFKVVNQVETPGLGARITEEAFQQSFVGKNVSGGIKMTKSGNAGPGEFDAITGATETSKSLERILNAGFARYSGISK